MSTEAVETQQVVVESDYDSPTWRQLSDFSVAVTGNNFPSHASYADLRLSSVRDMGSVARADRKVVEGEFGYVLEDVPHFTDYLPDVPVSLG